MAKLGKFEETQPRDGESLRFLCTFDAPGTTIVKSVVVTNEQAAMGKGQIGQLVLSQIGERSKESDRHAEFQLAKAANRPHRNPPQIWQQSIDPALHSQVSPADVIKALG